MTTDDYFKTKRRLATITSDDFRQKGRPTATSDDNF